MNALLTPRRILQHVVVLVVVVVLVQLGLWQLDRLGEVRERNAAQAENFDAPAADVEELLDGLTLDDTTGLAALEFRTVTASGTYRTGDEVLQRGRSNNGSSGYDVLTPLDLDAGGTVLVRRGWVPFDNDLRPPVLDATPPAGPVTVTGWVERSIPQPSGPFAQVDTYGTSAEIVFHADLDRLGGTQVVADERLLPMLVRLEAQEPAQPGQLPVPQPRPEQDEGTHLSYALQWFAFAVTAVGFYGVLLRRQVRGDGSLSSAPGAGATSDGP